MYRIFHIDTLVLLRDLLQTRQDDLEICVGYFMILGIRELGWNCLWIIVLNIGRSGVVCMGQDAFGRRGAAREGPGTYCREKGGSGDKWGDEGETTRRKAACAARVGGA